MGYLDDIENFEKQTTNSIIYNMVKWFEFDSVNIEYRVRDNVESGVWINIKIEQKGKTFWVDGQRNDIVRRRLIEWLTKHLERQRNSKN